jgi:hypothetical protein
MLMITDTATPTSVDEQVGDAVKSITDSDEKNVCRFIGPIVK